MDIRPIKTKRDCGRALRRIEAHLSAKRGTDDGDELEVLATLVEVYEQEHFPANAAEPLEAMLFRVDQQGLGATRFGGVYRIPSSCVRGSQP